MCDRELNELLTSTELNAPVDASRVEELRTWTLEAGRRAMDRPHRGRNALVATLAVVAISGVALAGTEAGRDFVRWVFTPVEEAQSVTWRAPKGERWTQVQTGREEAITPEEQEAVAKEFAEHYDSKQAGGGRLVGLIESPGFAGIGHTVYLIEYTLSTGEKSIVGSGAPTGVQAENMRLDEIMQLRDAGEGEIVQQKPFPIGMGKYTLRFTLSDGVIVELETFFPPGTRAEREGIFAEMRTLKAAHRFTVLSAMFDPANAVAGVWGTLQYELADGRAVGATEQIPAELISDDGTQVIMPDVDAAIPIEGAEPD